MENIFTNDSYYLLFIIFICFTNTSFAQKDFEKLTASSDSAYGYSAQNPLKLKNGNQGKSITRSQIFLSGLKTKDNQSLIYLFRATVNNPDYKEPKIKINNRFTGIPVGGKLGLLDKYVFVTSNTKDTVKLLVDIYSKRELMLPIGLKFEPKGN